MKVKTSYTHKQLRDMIEYVGFDDAARLRKDPQWREEGTYKESLENSFHLYSMVYGMG